MKRRLLVGLHSVGSDLVQVIAATLAFVGGVAAIVDWRDDSVGFPSQFYVAALLFAVAFLLARPAYTKLFATVDQEQKVVQQAVLMADQQDAERRKAHEDEQREALRWVQDNLPRYSRAARTIYEERRHQYLTGNLPPSEFSSVAPELRPYFETINELEQPVLNQINRIENEKIRKAANLIYILDRHMAFLMPSTWDSPDLYSGHTPSFLLVDREHQLTRMIGKVLRGESIDDELVEEFDHKAPD